MSVVSISDTAVAYLQDLLNSQEEETNIKIFVSDPGTMRAETCIVYCKIGEEEEDDVLMEVGNLSVYLENESLSFLEDSEHKQWCEDCRAQIAPRRDDSDALIRG